MQIVGTFQSYHQAPVPAVFDLLNSPPYQANFAQKVNIPDQYAFSHPTVTQQLENGRSMRDLTSVMHCVICIGLSMPDRGTGYGLGIVLVQVLRKSESIPNQYAFSYPTMTQQLEGNLMVQHELLLCITTHIHSLAVSPHGPMQYMHAPAWEALSEHVASRLPHSSWCMLYVLSSFTL